MHATRRVWFPLRSNVAYFETTGPRLDLTGRVKEMALLAEELFFEPGFLDVNVTEHGLSSWWLPPGTLTEEEIRNRRTAQRGGRFFVGFAAQEGPGLPAEAPTHAVVDGPLQQGFFAEYELSLREWGLEDVGWVNLGGIPEEADAAANEIARAEDRAEWPGRDLPKLSENDFLDGRLKQDLNLDLARGAVMRTPVVVDELHGPMLEHKTQSRSRFEGREVPGSSALKAWVPAFHAVPWKDIVALHDHDAIGAFRAKLIEVEDAVVDLPEQDRPAALKDIGLDELAKKVRELIPTRGRVAVEVGTNLLLDLLSTGVPFLGTGVAGLKGIAELQRQQTEWTAILLSLRERATPSPGPEE